MFLVSKHGRKSNFSGSSCSYLAGGFLSTNYVLLPVDHKSSFVTVLGILLRIKTGSCQEPGKQQSLNSQQFVPSTPPVLGLGLGFLGFHCLGGFSGFCALSTAQLLSLVQTCSTNNHSANHPVKRLHAPDYPSLMFNSILT